MKQPSWKTVADTLASRLRNHAFCDVHPISAPGETCPFCADRAAYRVWQIKTASPHLGGVR